MNILHCIYDHVNNPWVGGGGAVRVYEIYRRLSAKHYITVVSGKYPGSKDYQEGNLNFHFEGSHVNNYVLSTFSYAFKTALFLKKYSRSADIIIEDFAPYNPLFSKFFVKKPVALQVHHREGIQLFNRYFLFGLPFMIMESAYPRLFKNVICVSNESKKKFRTENAVVIPNGINRELFEVAPYDTDYIAYLGRLQIHNKGLDTLVEAMKAVNSKLLIAGRGKDESKLRTLIEQSNLSHNIQLAGFLSDDKKVGFIAHSKLVVLPSRYEGQGIVLIEAAACGKPVIVSDISELLYSVDAGFGISFRTGDAEDLSEKIKFLLGNDLLRQEMGNKGRSFAKNYTWDAAAEEFQKFLLEGIQTK
jgi:glycosyltransferase involved in cell wall biosynthesis